MTKEKLKWKGFLLIAKQQWGKLQEEEIQEEIYLKNLASQYSISKRRNYSLARSIVLDIHIIEEYYMNRTIAFLCLNGLPEIDSEIDMLELIEAVGNIDCFKKISILEKLNVLSAHSIETIKRLNNLRNAFAHGYKEGGPSYNYKGKSIFQKEGVDSLVADHRKVTENMTFFLEGNYKP